MTAQAELKSTSEVDLDPFVLLDFDVHVGPSLCASAINPTAITSVLINELGNGAGNQVDIEFSSLHTYSSSGSCGSLDISLRYTSDNTEYVSDSNTIIIDPGVKMTTQKDNDFGVDLYVQFTNGY